MAEIQKWIPTIVLLVIFVLIAVRKIGSVRLEIWQIMLFGAVVVLITGAIAPLDALWSINIDVLLFLFGMFIVGEALHRSTYLQHLTYLLFNRARGVNSLILFIILSMGFFSAVLLNDTVAIIGAPLVLLFARKYAISPKLLLLSLSFSITIGSVMSPIGNPQNLLIALSGVVKNPFADFLRFLFIPTVVNLLILFILLKVFYRKEFHKIPITHDHDELADPNLSRLCQVSLGIIFFMILVKILLVIFVVPWELPLTSVALLGALPIIVFSRRRLEILRNIDWKTLIFFAAMFVMMQSVWNSGVVMQVVGLLPLSMLEVPVILGSSVVFSQLLSNVPFVQLFIPLFVNLGAGMREMMALAAGSTIAGNLFIFGAASNIIVIQNAEKEGQTVGFLEFARVGIPLTIINLLVYWFFLSL